jgi:hypothetical protein
MCLIKEGDFNFKLKKGKRSLEILGVIVAKLSGGMVEVNIKSSFTHIIEK